MAVLNHLLWFFMIDLTSDGERKDCIVTILEFRNPVTLHLLEKFKFEVGKSLNNQDLMFQFGNVEVNHQVAVIVILSWQTRQWWKKDKIRSTRIVCCRIWNRWQYEIYYWRRFNRYRDRSKNGTSREIGIWRSVTRSIYKVRTGEIFDELEVEGFLRERLIEMATEIVIKNKKSLTIPSGCIVLVLRI